MKSSFPSFSACYHTDSSTKAIMFYLVPSRGDEAWSLQLNTLYQQSGFKCADFHISWQNSNDVGRLMFYLKNRWKHKLIVLSRLCVTKEQFSLRSIFVFLLATEINVQCWEQFAYRLQGFLFIFQYTELLQRSSAQKNFIVFHFKYSSFRETGVLPVSLKKKIG